MLRILLAGLVALTVPTCVLAQEQDGLLPVEQAFALRAEIREPGRIDLHWDIAKDYYLYKSRISAKTAQAGTTLGKPELPKGIERHDEFFGDVEIYHDAVDAHIDYTADPATTTIELSVTVQGCHEVDPKICYPPHPTRLALVVPAMAAATPSLFGSAPAGGVLGLAAQPLNDDEPLPAEQAFVFEAIAMSPTEVLARWTMPNGYYLYRDRSRVDAVDAAGVELGQPTWPQGIDHEDEHFGTVVVYYGQVELPIALKRADGAAGTFTLRGEFQGCKENGICYPVMQRDVVVDLPAASKEQLAAAAASFKPATPAAAMVADASADNALRSTAPPAITDGGVLGALLLAVLGGLILNLMPCVLPVLSLKVLGLAASGESLAKARGHALWYTAGVLAGFAIVGLGVVALRAAGQALGWGFQLQQPGFVAVLVYVLFAVGLSLSGVFTIGAGLGGVGQSLAGKSGPAGDFFTGLLACVVASPCTAPFMGPALAFAFAAAPVVALLIFLALGLGLALPFLVIGFVPALASRLPRPGAWMETFKQVLAFPMYLTAAWLLWVLGHQRGVDAIGWILAGAIVLALALWWHERSRWNGRTLGRVLAGIVFLVALWPLWKVTQLEPPAKAAVEASDGSVAYSADALARLRADGRTVFVNMTADWCVTCKANEKGVLSTDAFKAALERADAVYMKGDWTNTDPAITEFLQQHRAVGVPLYVVFSGREGPGQVLPTLLTTGIVEDALLATTR
ncbi:MAG: protein-disulfide reductase DsbD [Dokdonella sp.]|nr:protein-disulfide reductase DsbD [Dokdonella sp.]